MKLVLNEIIRAMQIQCSHEIDLCKVVLRIGFLADSLPLTTEESAMKPIFSKKGAYLVLNQLYFPELGHGRLYRWTENSFPFFLFLKPAEIN